MSVRCGNCARRLTFHFDFVNYESVEALFVRPTDCEPVVVRTLLCLLRRARSALIFVETSATIQASHSASRFVRQAVRESARMKI